MGRCLNESFHAETFLKVLDSQHPGTILSTSLAPSPLKLQVYYDTLLPQKIYNKATLSSSFKCLDETDLPPGDHTDGLPPLNSLGSSQPAEEQRKEK